MDVVDFLEVENALKPETLSVIVMPSRPSDGRCPQDGRRGSTSGLPCPRRALGVSEMKMRQGS